MPSEKEKADLAANTLKEFFDQFGSRDEVSVTFLDILLEELLSVNPHSILVDENEENVSLPSQSEQTGDQISDDIEERESSICSSIEPGIPETSDSLAKSGSKNHPGEQDALRTLGGDGEQLQRSAKSLEGKRVH